MSLDSIITDASTIVLDLNDEDTIWAVWLFYYDHCVLY